VKLFLAALLFTAAVSGQTKAPARIDVSKLGPQAGERVPDFSLKDQFGKIWTRDSLVQRNGAMLVFLRSADW
jgi:cytochrome oxidase Cu insertion factor (SCO1/SenC/PrrC family)